MNQEYLKELLEEIETKKLSKEDIAKLKVKLCKKHKLKEIPTDIEVLLNLDEKKQIKMKEFLNTKPVRTGSGVAVVAIMSAPFKCPHGKCTYCPGGPGSYFGDVPQSYTGNEPATMRGIRNNYDAYLQVMNRLEQYIAIGQNPEKVELIIMGGTFPSFDKKYQEEFVRDAFQAMNDFSELFYKKEFNIDKFKEFFSLPGKINDEKRTKDIHSKLLKLKEERKTSLVKAQNNNENSDIKCVGLTIETKPDWGLLEHGNEMLKLGCTRVELGVQTLNDEVLKKVNRGHNLETTKKCIKTLKDLGFKLNFHMMPGLPGIKRQEDIETFKELFEDEAYKPDMLKIYPTMVMPGTPLQEKMKKGEYEPLTTNEAADIISEAMRYAPRYCRIMRVQRDIPTKFSERGIDKNNLRQIVEEKVKEKGIKIQDIRAREIGRGTIKDPVELETIEYNASNGKEFFISLKDADDKLIGFVRLRIPSQTLREEFSEKTAIIRELHVYGAAQKLGVEGQVQHRGFGAKLMNEAEKIAKHHKRLEILVISGIGVRKYYKKLGYYKKGPYMFKIIEDKNERFK